MKWRFQLSCFLLGIVLAGVPDVARGEAYLNGRHPGRVVIIKVDGLAPEQMAAVAFPERVEFMERLPYAGELKKAIDYYKLRTGREFVLPNIRKYFFEEGVYFPNMFSETLTLSAAAWAVIDTGQPSVVKGHGTYTRDTSYIRSHLDGFRDTLDAVRHGESKTSALWNLDQAGVSLMLDAFDPDRAWSGPQIYRRLANWELLAEAGKRWLDNGEDSVSAIIRAHVSRQVTGLDYTDFNQELSGRMTARKILEKDLTGREKYDYLSPLFTLMDHQQHVDPHPKNIIYWLVKLDGLVGEIFSAVEKSERQGETVVALVSDHGSEIDPGRVAISFPITKVFRDKLLGGQNVKTMLVESAWNSVSLIVPGIDFPRIYESEFSPYNKSGHPQGEDGFVTCFIDSFGNSRSSVNLRNNDLNRLHLLLLRLKEKASPGEFARIKQKFQQVLDETRVWLEPDLALYEDYRVGAGDLADHLGKKADSFSRDSAWRLTEEVERDSVQIAALQRLLSIRFDGQGDTSFENFFGKEFEISDFVPKQYMGLANSHYQLSHHSIGLDANLEWVETTVDPKGRPVPMDFFSVIRNYRAPNAPSNGIFNPFDFLIKSLPIEQVLPALVRGGVVRESVPLNQVIWLMSTWKDHPVKGSEALLIKDARGRILYAPISGLRQLVDGSFEFEAGAATDPLGLTQGPGFETGDTPPVVWASSFRNRQSWMEATYQTEYGIAPIILLDILDDPVPGFVDSSDFQKYLIYFSSPENKDRYLRGLKRKYASLQPDFVVWANPLWNFNSKARTSGGSHSGLRPIVSRTAFLVWGGDDTGVSRGRIDETVGTTLDIVPTLFRAVGMLDAHNQVVRDPDSIPERPFARFPGQILDLWDRDPEAASPVALPVATDLNARRR